MKCKNPPKKIFEKRCFENKNGGAGGMRKTERIKRTMKKTTFTVDEVIKIIQNLISDDDYGSSYSEGYDRAWTNFVNEFKYLLPDEDVSEFIERINE